MNRRVKGHISSSSSPPPLLLPSFVSLLELHTWTCWRGKSVALAWEELIGQKWGWRRATGGGQQWPDTGGMCTSTARATVCPKSEGSAGGGKQSRGCRPAFHYLHPSAAAICAPLARITLPSPSPSHCCAEKLCHHLRTCRSVLLQQQGYSSSLDVTKHLVVSVTQI